MTTDDSTTTEYFFDSASAGGRKQVDHLQAMFDPVTTNFLGDVGVQPGARCLEVGPGSGSICRWMVDRVGPSGQVVAVDLATEQLDVPPQVEVYRHDIGEGLPTDGGFDLVCARFVLMHLSGREQILRTLIDALAPGGWLVLGDSPQRPQEVLAAPSAADAALADRVVSAGMALAVKAEGAWDWAYAAQGHFAALGLQDIRGIEFSPMVTGGESGALLVSNYIAQLGSLLLDEGITEAEIDRFQSLMHDPRFRTWPFMRLVLTAGRKELTAEVQR